MGGDSQARSLDPTDRARVVRSLSQHGPRDFEALRTRALVLLAMGSALRVSELVALNVAQVVGNGGVRSSAFLTAEQSKGGRAGTFVVPKNARDAVRRYLAEGKRRGIMHDGGPLFVAYRRNHQTPAAVRSGKTHPRLTSRGAQHAFKRAQQRATIVPPYRFHDLRHDALTRFADACHGDPFKVQAFGRLKDVRTASRYVHTSPTAIAAIAEAAERSSTRG